MRARRALSLTGLLFVTALAGCASDEGEGSASIYVQDAPADDFEEIHLIFSEVLIHQAGADDENESDASDEDGEGDEGAGGAGDEGQGGWITVFEDAGGVDIDLKNVTGTHAAFLGEANLTAGRYTQIRVVVLEAYGIDADGERTDFDMPSGTAKIVRSFNVEAGQESRIVLDIDLDRALKQAGPTGYILTPVIGKASVEIVDGSTSGADVHAPGEAAQVA